ncbi:MAG: response regulator transcription factor [Balneolaceae bacterium]
MAKVRVLIAESSDIALSGILTILNGSRTIDIAETAQSAPEALRLYVKIQPDICLISNTLKNLNISEFMQKIFSTNNEARVIILTDSINVTLLNQALKAGVSGCLSKSIDKKKFREAIQSAAQGEKVFSDSVSSLMTERYARITQNRSGQKTLEQITKREAEILQLIVDGYTSQEIAKLLFISPRTVETHRSNLLQKLKIKNTAGLVRYALQEGHLSGS